MNTPNRFTFTRARTLRSRGILALAALLLCAPASQAALLVMDLTCSLNGLNSNGSCSPGPSFGTVTLEDLAGGDAGKVQVTVDLGFAGNQKFRDLMLNFSGAATTITDDDAGNTVSLNGNSFSITPYGGLFDVGGSGGQGWSATTAGTYSTKLSGNVPLSTADFNTLDSLGNLYAALHIQEIGSANGGNCDGTNNPACVPGMPGPGSLKIGAPNVVPEPTSLVLFGIGLVVSLAGRRSRTEQRRG